MVVNARNPFGRILSAWRDKFRLGLTETLVVYWLVPFWVHHLINKFWCETTFSTHASASRQRPFLPAMDVFKNHTTPDGFVRSFEAFAEYLASNPSTFVQNRHWQSIYYHCRWKVNKYGIFWTVPCWPLKSPCHFNYDLIVHLETIGDDFHEVWKRLDFTPSPSLSGKALKLWNF